MNEFLFFQFDNHQANKLKICKYLWNKNLHKQTFIVPKTDGHRFCFCLSIMIEINLDFFLSRIIEMVNGHPRISKQNKMNLSMAKRTPLMSVLYFAVFNEIFWEQ